MENIFEKYNNLCKTPSDINEHLPTLFKYASQCDSAFETGVRGVISSWALLYGLISNNNGNTKYFLMNDIVPCDIDEINNSIETINKENQIVKLDFLWKNNLEIEFENNQIFDLTFIDTLHCYGQLRRELDKFSKNTNKYIIMHDTSIDEFKGEIFRSNNSILEYKQMTGFTDDNDILLGLSQAIEQFLNKNKDWILLEKFTNNNGLTVLKRI
jgi:hypothetical protein